MPLVRKNPSHIQKVPFFSLRPRRFYLLSFLSGFFLLTQGRGVLLLFGFAPKSIAIFTRGSLFPITSAFFLSTSLAPFWLALPCVRKNLSGTTEGLFFYVFVGQICRRLAFLPRKILSCGAKRDFDGGAKQNSGCLPLRLFYFGDAALF